MKKQFAGSGRIDAINLAALIESVHSDNRRDYTMAAFKQSSFTRNSLRWLAEAINDPRCKINTAGVKDYWSNNMSATDSNMLLRALKKVLTVGNG